MKCLPWNLAISLSRSRRRPARRGVLLLVVLSMLMLFALIGVTFVLVASQARRAMRGEARQEQYGDDPQRHLDQVFLQVIRDTTNPRSVLRGHSLLNDLYGNDGASGQVATASAMAGGQFVELQATTVTSPLFGTNTAPLQTAGRYNGCVLTMTSGNAAGQSTRIVGWGYASGTYVIRVLATESINTTNIAQNDLFLINGRPFNGTGFGFNSATGKLDAKGIFQTTTQTSVPYALLPNGVYFPGTDSARQGYNATGYTVFGGIGGADEDHDAPTPQDMLLGYKPLDPTPVSPTQSAIIPSLHRPDLLNHMRSQPAFNAPQNTDPLKKIDMERMVLMRPHVYDHPNFPRLTSETGGPWDVDNDGDGIADSIWVDVGFPAQTAPDGRRFKPLAAILCLDLDGRLNVNAHGTLAETDPNFARPGNLLGLSPSGIYTTLPKYASNPTGYYLGQGYGPADVSLAALFTTSTQYQALLAGQPMSPGVTTYEGRYGQRSSSTPAAYPGATGSLSSLALLKFFEYPVANYPAGVPNYPAVLSAFGAPSDLWVRGYTGLDPRGTPLQPGLYWPSASFAAETLNNPYDLNLSRKTVRSALTQNGIDNPFTPAELERVLRIYDLDAANLPDRLRALVDVGRPMSLIRNLVTTDSYDVPVAGMLPPTELRSGTTYAQHIVDLIRLKNATITDAQLNTLIPPELAAGLRMDLNRAFGNGRDDNSNGVVDEPNEASTSASPLEYVWFGAKGPTQPTTPAAMSAFSGARFDHNNDGQYDASDMYARQVYARHLYVLMMLLKPASLQIDFDPNNPANDAAETARGIAQWAVNVVDFRDRDAVMTPFKYMIDPFSAGWTSNYDVTSVGAGEGVVWGCERPELLISETLAFHDRRTEDLPNYNKTTDTPPNKDDDFDQSLRPLGSFFVELYNPWSTQASTFNADGTANTNGNPSLFEVPGEFYDVKNGSPTGIQLDRRSPDGSGNTNTTGSPVWRLLIAKGSNFINGTTDRKDPDDPINPLAGGDIERSVYFVDVTNVSTPLTNDGTRYYSNLTVDPVLPGRYAVVGSAGFNVGGQYVTPIGRQTSWTTDPKTLSDYTTNARCIVLNPGQGAGTNQVQVYNNGSTEPPPIQGGSMSPNNVQPVVAAVINNRVGALSQTSLSISEPTGAAGDSDYPPATVPPTFVEPKYPSVPDAPLDEARTANPDYVALGKNGTTANYRTVYLQRLANPMADFNSQTNPYLTVDSMSVDLTVFNGVDKTGATDPKVTSSDVGLASLQRGDSETTTVASQKNQLWKHQIANTAPVSTPGGVSGQIYQYFMQHTLGYLNKFTNNPAGSSNTPTNALANGNPYGQQYVGSPNNVPFPWMTWNNRPFVGPLEVMQVPRSRSSRLMHDYVMPTGTPTYYTPAGTPPSAGFDHLLNFFTTDASTNAAHFYRLFDYVGVPSRFVGTVTMLNPTSFASALTSSTSLTEAQTYSQFHPPFNKVSNYREPGKININTIPSDNNSGTVSTVWNALLNGGPGPTWQQMTESRRGYSSGSATELLYDTSSTYASYFSNPFRSAPGAALMLPSGGSSTPPNRREVDVTLLRPQGSDPGQQSSASLPLLSYQSTGLVDETNRNSYFRYQAIQRMSNLVTTRSNVYAIWITVGYFEVSPAPVRSGSTYDANIYPDGLQLGAELGSDTGDVKRHRAFYIFDRSIPMGFEPGRDHNTSNGVLVRRYIE